MRLNTRRKCFRSTANWKYDRRNKKYKLNRRQHVNRMHESILPKLDHLQTYNPKWQGDVGRLKSRSVLRYLHIRTHLKYPNGRWQIRYSLPLFWPYILLLSDFEIWPQFITWYLWEIELRTEDLTKELTKHNPLQLR
jgi:hypothetical protein